MSSVALQSGHRPQNDAATSPALSGIWVTIAAVTMAFAAFTSSLIIRQASGNDWRHMDLPGILYFNTLILVTSSATLEAARRKGLAGLGATRRWLFVTLFLGVLFLAGQVFAWHQLRVQGLYLATSPNSSFFYVLTVLHALHMLGGLLGFVYSTRRTCLPASWRPAALEAAVVYWHFLAGLWIYLLIVLRTRL